jgi:hypothetical protein
MLAGVLLHVIEAARPIENPPHLFGWKLIVEDVPHHPVLDDDIPHAHPIERPQVIRLSAAGWVERGVIEGYRRLVADDLSPNDMRRELSQIWILEVETLGRHGGYSFLANA